MIYEEFIGEEDVDEQLAAALPAILFAREIRCDDPHIAGVVVRHRQLRQEETAAFVNGRAMIAVSTAQPQIFLTDRLGRRYSSSIGYTVHRMVHLDHLIVKCLPYVGDNVRVLLPVCYEKAVSENRTGEDIAGMRETDPWDCGGRNRNGRDPCLPYKCNIILIIFRGSFWTGNWSIWTGNRFCRETVANLSSIVRCDS